MAVRRRQVGTIVILSLKGSFFGDQETDELEKAVMDEAANRNQRLVLNLSECNAMNSTAIGVVMRGYSNYKMRGGEIKLCGLQKSVMTIFVVAKLIMLFDHHATEEQALAAFATPENPAG